MNKKMSYTYIALAVAQLVSTTVYAQTMSNGCQAANNGNSFMSHRAQTQANTEVQTAVLARSYAEAFKSIGLTGVQAAGIVGNLMHESGLNSGIMQGGAIMQLQEGAASVVNQTGYGISQWGESRRDALMGQAKELGVPVSSQCANFTFLIKELLGDYSQSITALMSAKDLVTAVCSFEKTYLIPSDPQSQGRINYARQVMAWLGETSYAMGTPSPVGDPCDNYNGSSSIATAGAGSTATVDAGNSAANKGGGSSTSCDGSKSSATSRSGGQYASFIQNRTDLMNATNDKALKAHFQAEIDLVNSWGQVGVNGGQSTNNCAAESGNNASGAQNNSGAGTTGSQNSIQQSSNTTPASKPATISGGYPANGTGGWGTADLQIGKDKIVELWPLIQGAAAMNNIPARVLGAIILQEGRGMTVAQLRNAAGVAQIGKTEIDALREGRAPANGSSIPTHPELTADYLSEQNQVYGAAAYLRYILDNLSGGDMTRAVGIYNGGPNAGGGLNDPAYIQKHQEALSIFDSLGIK